MKELKEITLYYNNDLYEGKSEIVSVDTSLIDLEVMKLYLGSFYVNEYTCDWNKSAYYDKKQEVPFTFRVKTIEPREL